MLTVIGLDTNLDNNECEIVEKALTVHAYICNTND